MLTKRKRKYQNIFLPLNILYYIVLIIDDIITYSGMSCTFGRRALLTFSKYSKYENYNK